MTDQFDDAGRDARSRESRRFDRFPDESEAEQDFRDPLPRRRRFGVARDGLRELAPQAEDAIPDERRVNDRMERDAVAGPRRAVSSLVAQIAERAVRALAPVKVLTDRLVHQRFYAYRHGVGRAVQIGEQADADQLAIGGRRGAVDCGGPANHRARELGVHAPLRLRSPVLKRLDCGVQDRADRRRSDGV